MSACLPYRDALHPPGRAFRAASGRVHVMTRHTRTRRRNLCACLLCKSPDTVHGTSDQHIDGCDCDYCTRAADTKRRLTDYIIRTETKC